MHSGEQVIGALVAFEEVFFNYVFDALLGYLVLEETEIVGVEVGIA